MSSIRTDNLLHLDLARGIAAIMVMIGHLRSYLFVAPSELEYVSLTDKLFYFVTGFGREAVVTFFVLSGFFITKSIVGMVDRNQWSWHSYLINRLARLWTVLIPALLLTLLWDQLGITLTGSGYYAGDFLEQYERGPSAPGIELGLLTFFGNVFFLQNIETAVYGTNFPLWSLSYEFWYYILFPLAFVPFVTKQNLIKKICSAVLFCLLVAWLPKDVLLLGFVWLCGSAVYYINSRSSLAEKFHHPIVLVLSFLALGMVLTVSRVGILNQGIVVDLLIGVAFSLVMLGLIPRKPRQKAYGAVATVSSNMSYSLYLVHDSFIAFIACYFLHNKVVPISLSMFAIFCVITLVYSYLVYWCFERNTKNVAALARKTIAPLVQAHR